MRRGVRRPEARPDRLRPALTRALPPLPEAGARGRGFLAPQFLLVGGLTLCYFLSVGMVLALLPRFVEGPLGAGNREVGLVVGAFAITAVVVRPFAGRTSDRRGRRPMVVSGAAIVAVSVAGHAAVSSVGALLLLRLLNGAGEALFFVGTASAVNDLAPEGRRGEAISFFSLAVFVGLGGGPAFGEWLLAGYGYATAWYVAAALTATAAVAGLALRDHRTGDLAGGPPAALVHRAALVPGLLLGASIWGIAGFGAFVPLYALDLGLAGAGPVLAVSSGIVLAIRAFGARLPDRLGAGRTASVSFVASAAGLGTMALVRSPAGLYGGTVVLAIGQALAFPALMALAVDAAAASERGAVVATFTAFFDLSFGLGGAAQGAIAEVTGYQGVFASGALAALAGLAGVRAALGRRRTALPRR